MNNVHASRLTLVSREAKEEVPLATASRRTHMSILQGKTLLK